MDIVIQPINTVAITAQCIKEKLDELYKTNKQGTATVKLSLDTTHPVEVKINLISDNGSFDAELKYIEKGKEFCNAYISDICKNSDNMNTACIEDWLRRIDTALTAEKKQIELEKALVQKCYESYKLDWMLSHGYSITDLIEGLIKADGESEAYRIGDARTRIRTAASYLEHESGLNGYMWACQDEFFNTEFRDKDYMEHLFSVMKDGSMLRTQYYLSFGRDDADAANTQKEGIPVKYTYKKETI